MGFNPRGAETKIYSLDQDDLCLVGTAEITLGGLLLDRIVEEEELPLRVAGISHCFRVEAGAYGRESRGLYRVHQFTKVEMFVFCTPEQSDDLHRELLAVEEGIFRDLEIPYRVIDVASGDLGAPAYRKFDIEAWMPGRSEGGRLRRDHQRVELHRLPGAPAAGALPAQGREEDRARPHPERHGDLERARPS